MSILPLRRLFVRKATLAVPSAPQAIGSAFKLTPTELRVLLAIVEVGGVPEVATAFGIADTTVRTHVTRLFEKTGTSRQADLVKLVAGYATPLSGLSATGIVTRRSLLIPVAARPPSRFGNVGRRRSNASSDVPRTTPKRQLFRMAGVRPESRGSAGDPASDVPAF